MRWLNNKPVSAEAIADLRESVGWNRMENAYSDSSLVSYYHIAVYDNHALVGYIDCVSNGVTDAYIQDLMVRPDYQGQGIGTALMNRMITALKDKRIYMISVIYEEGLKPFYDRFGFSKMLSGQIQVYESESSKLP